MMPNKFHAYCFACTAPVGPGEGRLYGKAPDGGWMVYCLTCHLGETSPTLDPEEIARANARLDARVEAERRAKAASEEWARAKKSRPVDDVIDLEEIRRQLEDIIRRHGRDPLRPGGRSVFVPECLRVLGLKPPVDVATVKAAYRQLAKQHHPDAGGDSKTFVAIERAYRDALTLTGRAS